MRCENYVGSGVIAISKYPALAQRTVAHINYILNEDGQSIDTR